MQVAPLEGHTIWAESYDRDPNPLLALETRVLAPRLGVLAGARFLDVATGTGRWMSFAEAGGARVYGIDLCESMLLRAARKPGLAGKLALADCVAIPMRDSAFDVALCSFALGYLPSLETALREMARVARRVIISDLHPAATLQGWKRGFRAGEIQYELEHFLHSEDTLVSAARNVGLVADWAIDASLGQPEYHFFQSAGKERIFEELKRVTALRITAWVW